VRPLRPVLERRTELVSRATESDPDEAVHW